MKNKLSRLAVMIFMCVGMIVAAAGCGMAADKAYPISIGGVEVIVGETKVSALVDAGYQFSTLVDTTSVEISADDMLDADSYYTSIYLELSGKKAARMAVATDKESVPFSSATIADIDFMESADFSEVSFDGVPIGELTREIVKEHVSGIKDSEDGERLYISTNNYYTTFTFVDDKVTEFQVQRKYDVEYNN